MNKLKKSALAICLSLIACLTLEAAVPAQFTAAATVAVKKTTLKTGKLYVRVGEKIKVELNNKNSKATYSFKSSNTKLATVAKDGTVSGKKAGTVTVTVTQTLSKKKTEVGKVTVVVQPKLDYDKMIARSLISTGNNFRMQNAIKKAKNGEDVTIAYIGGSITEGANATTMDKSWANLSYEYFKKTFGKGDGSNVHYVNAGMSGTPSTLGMIRYDRDIVGYAASAPDIVFIEFAVNDGDDTTKGDAFESLVRNILNSENQPAVVLMFSVFQSGRWNLQDRLQPVGEHYELPMISIKNAIVPELDKSALVDNQFWAGDGWHPFDYGHQIMGDCVNYYFDTVSKEKAAETDIAIPEEAAIGKSFEGIVMIDSKNIPEGVTVRAGGFSGTDMALGTYKYDYTRKTFPNNWMHTSTSGKTSFKMTLDCKNLVMVYKKSGDAKAFGRAEVYVDGVLVKTFAGNGGWNNPWTEVLINNTETDQHTIEIKMAADATKGENNAAKAFSILAFGYTK